MSGRNEACVQQANAVYNFFDHAVGVVNQNATPMHKIIWSNGKNGRKCRVFVLHDNRIFVFLRKISDLTAPTAPLTSGDVRVDVEEVDYTNTTPEQALILNILTTPKFRVYQMMYILFYLLDNTALAVIVVLSIITGTFDMAFYIGVGREIALVSAVGVEIFYDIMLNANKYWALQRVSFYIGLLLFAVYFTVVGVKKLRGDYDDDHDYWVIMGVLIFRLGAFLLEEFVDIGIDCCMHNTLAEAYHVKVPKRNSTAASVDQKDIKFPGGLVYEGSFLAWGFHSVYQWIEDHDDQPGLVRGNAMYNYVANAKTDPGAAAADALKQSLLSHQLQSQAQQPQQQQPQQQEQAPSVVTSSPLVTPEASVASSRSSSMSSIWSIADTEQPREEDLAEFSSWWLCPLFLFPAILTFALASIVSFMALLASHVVFFVGRLFTSTTNYKHYCREMLDEYRVLQEMKSEVFGWGNKK
jgi:hypothetical protein